MTGPADRAPSRLARRLGVGDAIVVGLGSMIGAGVFAAVGPAARAAGSGLLLGLAIAAFVAYCDPARTIPRAIPRALAITLVVYAAVAMSALAAVGPDALARSDAPLATAVGAGSLDALTPAVRVGGTIAAIGVLLSLVAGVSRTAFAMAADRELPAWFDAVHPVHRIPHRAELAVGLLVAAVVAAIDVGHAIGFSSFCVLVYYGIANASARTLPEHERRWPRALAACGIVGCAALALTLPAGDVLAGACVLAIGALVWTVRHRRSG